MNSSDRREYEDECQKVRELEEGKERAEKMALRLRQQNQFLKGLVQNLIDKDAEHNGLQCPVAAVAQMYLRTHPE